jgi:hypothetical protein
MVNYSLIEGLKCPFFVAKNGYFERYNGFGYRERRTGVFTGKNWVISGCFSGDFGGA